MDNTNIIYHSDDYSDIDDESITILDKETMNNYLINHTNNNLKKGIHLETFFYL